MLPRKEIPLNMSYILFRNVYCGNAGDKTRVTLVLFFVLPTHKCDHEFLFKWAACAESPTHDQNVQQKSKAAYLFPKCWRTQRGHSVHVYCWVYTDAGKPCDVTRAARNTGVFLNNCCTFLDTVLLPSMLLSSKQAPLLQVPLVSRKMLVHCPSNTVYLFVINFHYDFSDKPLLA